jgi:hypothetical protein
MGETQEGEGRTGGPTTIQVARAILREYSSEDGIPDEIRVRSAGEGLYAVEVLFRGVPVPETRFVRIRDDG